MGFQVLIARGFPPLKAKQEITDNLRLGNLRVDFHIAAGARKTRPMRQATPEELQAEQAGKSLDFLYEVSPPGGITQPLDPQNWHAIFALAIRDGRLVIEPCCPLDFSWQAHSFSIANPVVIDELWRPPANTPAAVKQVEEPERPPANADKVTQLVWALGEFEGTDELTGLRGPALRERVCLKVGQHFTASQRTFQQAVQEYRKTHSA